MAYGIDTPQARAQVAVEIVAPILASLAVVGRFYARRTKKIRFSLEDWLLVPALIFHYVLAALGIYSVCYGGYGHTIKEVGKDKLKWDLMFPAIGDYFYAAAMVLIRSSLCILLVRIFVVRTFKIVAYSVLVLNILWFCFVLIQASVTCIPFEANWDPSKGHCTNPNALYVVVAVWAIVVDICIWTMPLPMVWRLQMPTSSKIGLTCTFALGLFDIIVCIMRIISILSISFTGDFTLSATSATIWAFLEPPVGIIVACFPAYRPLLEYFFPERVVKTVKKAFGTKRSTKSYGQLDEDTYELTSRGTHKTEPSLDDSNTRLDAAPHVTRGTARGDVAMRPDELERDIQTHGIGVKRDITVIAD